MSRVRALKGSALKSRIELLLVAAFLAASLQAQNPPQKPHATLPDPPPKVEQKAKAPEHSEPTDHEKVELWTLISEVEKAATEAQNAQQKVQVLSQQFNNKVDELRAPHNAQGCPMDYAKMTWIWSECKPPEAKKK